MNESEPKTIRFEKELIEKMSKNVIKELEIQKIKKMLLHLTNISSKIHLYE